MARTRITISLDVHELALVQQAMRVFSTAISNDLYGKVEEIPFDGSQFNNNWNLIYTMVEDIRSTLGDGEPRMPEIAIDRQPPARIEPPQEEYYEPPPARRRRKTSTMTQVRKARRTASKVRRWLK
jgi:hypothetical protein